MWRLMIRTILASLGAPSFGKYLKQEKQSYVWGASGFLGGGIFFRSGLGSLARVASLFPFAYLKSVSRLFHKKKTCLRVQLGMTSQRNVKSYHTSAAPNENATPSPPPPRPSNNKKHFCQGWGRTGVTRPSGSKPVYVGKRRVLRSNCMKVHRFLAKMASKWRRSLTSKVVGKKKIIMIIIIGDSRCCVPT